MCFTLYKAIWHPHHNNCGNEKKLHQTIQRNVNFNSQQVAIVITDGEQTTTKEYTPLNIASKRIKDKGVEVFALGVGGGVNVDQLREIASSNDNVFTSPSFEELVNVVKPIVEKSCPSKGISCSWKQT